MLHRVLGVGFVALVGVLAGACVASGPEDPSEPAQDPEVASLEGNDATAAAEEQAAEEQEDFDVDAESVSESESAPVAPYCALELVEPCIAPLAVCAVRCCDGTLHKSYQYCGNCGTWAAGACANHGTRKRIRWECPCYY